MATTLLPESHGRSVADTLELLSRLFDIPARQGATRRDFLRHAGPRRGDCVCFPAGSPAHRRYRPPATIQSRRRYPSGPDWPAWPARTSSRTTAFAPRCTRRQPASVVAVVRYGVYSPARWRSVAASSSTICARSCSGMRNGSSSPRRMCRSRGAKSSITFMAGATRTQPWWPDFVTLSPRCGSTSIDSYERLQRRPTHPRTSRWTEPTCLPTWKARTAWGFPAGPLAKAVIVEAYEAEYGLQPRLRTV